MPKSSTPVVMYFEEERSSYDSRETFYHVYASFRLLIGGNLEHSESYNAPWNERRPDLNGLRIYSQSSSRDNPRRLYGWEAEYHNVYSIPLGTAERMAKTLRAIENGLKKSREQDGIPTSFGHYCARIARTLRVEHFGFQSNNRYSQYPYQLMSIGEGIDHVNWLVNQWIHENEIKADVLQLPMAQ
ncbi:MAG: hypothetical protein KGJ13_08105 [Patescibacteria group bacterium]|nr:hypothetical protein [Patescibacteria group bacterium]